MIREIICGVNNTNLYSVHDDIYSVDCITLWVSWLTDTVKHIISYFRTLQCKFDLDQLLLFHSFSVLLSSSVCFSNSRGRENRKRPQAGRLFFLFSSFLRETNDLSKAKLDRAKQSCLCERPLLQISLLFTMWTLMTAGMCTCALWGNCCQSSVAWSCTLRECYVKKMCVPSSGYTFSE